MERQRNYKSQNQFKKKTLKIWMTHSIQFQHGIKRTDTMINETDLSAQK